MSAPGLREELRDGALWWVLDNPRRRNAVHPDALRWIATRCPQLRGETVVLTGAGDEAFCAGFDLTALEPTVDGPAPDVPLALATDAMEQADATFIAAIGGFAIGAGIELACASDLRVARADAWFQIPAARLGVVYHAAGLMRLHAVLGPALVARLLLLGDRVEALDVAFANVATIVPPETFEETLARMVEALQAGAPLSQRAHRDFFRTLRRGDTDPALLARHEEARALAYGRIREERVAKPGDSG